MKTCTDAAFPIDVAPDDPVSTVGAAPAAIAGVLRQAIRLTSMFDEIKTHLSVCGGLGDPPPRGTFPEAESDGFASSRLEPALPSWCSSLSVFASEEDCPSSSLSGVDEPAVGARVLRVVDVVDTLSARF